MLSFRSSKREEEPQVEPKGFDDFELRLGDVMRGERATMGKSLLDVQRELRIKASYIAAIENCDPDAFDTPGFIAGYVRSYARYLNMEPDETFALFCAESGFQVAHGMSEEASSRHKPTREERLSGGGSGRDMFASPATPFIPTTESIFSRIEPGAIGSMLVLVGLIAGIGYGGYSVLREVQQVQVTPVDQAPIVLSEIDPVAGADFAEAGMPGTASEISQAPSVAQRRDALDRLYRPQALDVPVLVARDAPIATLDPRQTGAFVGSGALAGAGDVLTAEREVEENADADLVALLDELTAPVEQAGQPSLSVGPSVPKVVEELGPTIRMVAANKTWVRVRSAEGNTLFEKIMEAGDTYDVPLTEVPPTLRTGNSGAVYFAMGADCYGPVGGVGKVTSNISLERVALSERFALVMPDNQKDALNRMVARLAPLDPSLISKLPCKSD